MKPDIMLSVLRVVAGLLFLEHGTQKILHFPPDAAAHYPVLASLAGLSGFIELIGGVLIVLGLFTRVAAFICSGEMAVAYFMAHFPHSLYPIVNKGEMAVLYCFVFLYLACAGGGAFSLDVAMRRK